MKPDREGQVKAVYMHLHAGGWTLMGEDTYEKSRVLLLPSSPY